MSWLRMDDKYPRHPKLTTLSRGDRWTWTEVLCYCAEYGTEGHVPLTIGEVLPYAKRPFLERAHAAGLLDPNGDGYVVHNWNKYNPKDPTKAERQARWRRSRDGDVDAPVDTPVDGLVDDAVDASVDSDVDASRVGTRARPVPSRTTEGSTRSLNPPNPEARPAARTTDPDDPNPYAPLADVGLIDLGFIDYGRALGVVAGDEDE